MSETADQGTKPPAQTRNFRLIAGALVLGALGLILWFALRDSGSSSKATPSNVTAVSTRQLRALASSVAHPVFWLGPKQGFTYELTREGNGSIIVRYLPKGVDVGSPKSYLSVATYPLSDAFGATQNVAKQRGSTSVHIALGGLAVVEANHPNNVHIGYPGVDYQVEVFDPTAGVAMGLVAGGQLRVLGKLTQGSTSPQTPIAASASAMAALAKSLGHPIYWLGPRAGYTYELGQSANGQITVRYLPAGVKPGESGPYRAVGTYPFQNAFGAMQALAKQKGAQSIKLAGGGLAVVDASDPKSIHLAYPGQNLQIEVFDPLPSVVRQLVASGKVTAIR